MRYSRFGMLVLAALLLAPLGSTFTPTAAADTPAVKWSDPAAWPDGKLPAAGDRVTIPRGERVLLDISPPALGGLSIDGELIFAPEDIRLETEWIIIHGLLQIGTEDEPFTHRAEIVLTDANPGEDLHGMGDRVIGVMSGALEIHGEPRLTSWTRLDQTAAAGATTLSVEGKTDWRAGDHLVIASTDFDPHQAEEVVIAAVDDAGITLEEPLVYTHWGEDQQYGDQILNERAEVGLLSRNILIRGDDDAATSGYGGHVMVEGGTARIEGAEFTAMGQAGELARYPIHFHMLGDRPDAYVRNNAIHRVFNRCVTVHGTNDVLIENNVAFSTYGHCYFMEDGSETGNQFIGNLGVLTMRPPESLQIIPSDNSPATFWITNPDNTIRDNVAAGSESFGFWYALPEHPIGLSASEENDAAIWPRRTPLKEFSGNTAHSNDANGLHVDEGPDLDGLPQVTVYEPRTEVIPPADGEEDAPTITATFAGFTAYKNRERGIWLRGVDHVVTGAILADNAIGATFASYESYLEDSLLIGESANLGTPADWEPVGEGGRSLPKPWEQDFPIRGYEFYDGVVGARDVTFAAFIPRLTRPASGVGFLLDDEFPLDPRNSISGAVWLDDSNRVYLEDGYPFADGSKSSVFQDVDGSVTGTAGVYVVPRTSFMKSEGCEPTAGWNASVCSTTYVGFGIENLDDTPGELGGMTIIRASGAASTLIGVPADDGYPRSSYYTSVPLGDSLTVDPGAWPAQRLRFSLFGVSGPATLTVRIPSPGDGWFVYKDYDWSPSGEVIKANSYDEVAESGGWTYWVDPASGDITIFFTIDGEYDNSVIDFCVNPECA